MAQKVLIVDDERFFREAIRDVLERAELECVTATGGSEGLELAQDPSVGAVVLDIELPGVSGIDVLREMRKLRPELRVVVLSAHTDQQFVLEALRLGACDYLAKPLHEEELLLSVTRALETYQIHSSWARLRSRLDALGTTLADLTREASDSSDPAGQIVEGAVRASSSLLDSTRVSLMLLDDDGVTLRVTGAVGNKVTVEEMSTVPVGAGVAGQAFSRGEAILVNGIDDRHRFPGFSPNEGYVSDSFIVAPVVSGSNRMGVLCATDRAGGAYYDEEDVALVRILGHQIANLLLNARRWLDDEDTASFEPLDTAEFSDAELARMVCEAVTAEVDPARVLHAALRSVARARGAAPVSLFLLDPAGRFRREGEVDGGVRPDRAELPVGRGLTGTVLETGLLVASASPETDPRFDPSVDTPEGDGSQPFLCLPLRFRGKTLGVFRAFFEAGETPSARTGEVLGAALSAAVRNVLLYRSLVETIEEVARARREAGAPQRTRA